MKRIHLEQLSDDQWRATSPDDHAVFVTADSPQRAAELAMEQYREMVRLRKMRGDTTAP
ncbi:hypothetical protein [uncultured Roseovarius sp.]|uniref:hypothetical protein n=1 Tax=uncultured Roseovarius sp. TaxID=293344 RepID=UPI00260BF6C2|nr:hypothetical protein [uncultured Roseovarius sp.]